MVSANEPGKFLTPALPLLAPLELFFKGAKRGPQNDYTRVERMGMKIMCSLMP